MMLDANGRNPERLDCKLAQECGVMGSIYVICSTKNRRTRHLEYCNGQS